MRLCDFCRPFYASTKSACGIKGKTSQAAIADFFMSTALGEVAKIELIFTEDQFRKWFKGDREPKAELWARVSDVFDDTRFSRTVSSKLNEQTIPELFSAFGIVLNQNEIPDKFAFTAALAKQFGAIARGNGEAEDIVNAIYRQCLNVSDFPDYVMNSQAKYSKLKTLLYSSEERQFDEFFVCNTISKIPRRFRRAPESARIENVTLPILAGDGRYTLLVGMGGIGKSMMMRHLFLASIREYSKTGFLPVLVTLREFGADNNDLFNVIVDSVHRFDISFSAAHVNKLLIEGRLQLLLDGLDEIKVSDMDQFQKQLDALIDRYPKNQYVMSTRRFSSFVELSRFNVLYMMPFSNEQALELVDRLEYCPEEPKLKQQFRERLVKEYFKTHAEFVTNPLLLTLMLMSYHRFADVPEKKYLFYEQAYQTLLQRHDSDKLAYKRVFRSVTDPADFTWVFREFCAKSYRKGEYEFDQKKFEDYFDKVKSIDRMDRSIMRVDNFLFDVCHSACLMYEEGQSYHFLHRSFQEYFFADYYSRQDDSTLIKLGNFMDKAEISLFDDGSAVDMLYDLAPDKVERFIIMPYLKKIFDLDTYEKRYWTFLKSGYGSWYYTILNNGLIEDAKNKFDIRERYPVMIYDVDPSSVIMALVLSVLGISHVFKMNESHEELQYEELICEKLYGEIFSSDPERKDIVFMPTMRIPEHILNDPEQLKAAKFNERLLLDDSGNPVVLGCIYAFDFSLALKEPEKYSKAKEVWEKESCPAKDVYLKVATYYESLKNKHEHADELDDDDF